MGFLIRVVRNVVLILGFLVAVVVAAYALTRDVARQEQFQAEFGFQLPPPSKLTPGQREVARPAVTKALDDASLELSTCEANIAYQINKRQRRITAAEQQLAMAEAVRSTDIKTVQKALDDIHEAEAGLKAAQLELKTMNAVSDYCASERDRLRNRQRAAQAYGLWAAVPTK